MPPRKLLLIGWDAADWAMIHPLLDQGEMPNLQRIIESGVMGKLSTLDPPVSPVLWTSIATGKTADEHGILGFLEPDPISGGARPATSTSRNCKAIWNILHQNGLRTHVVNWFASHPAEPIRGVCISNAASKVTVDIPAGSIHPPELTPTLTSLRLSPEDLRGEDLALFLPQLDRIDWTRDTRPVQLAQLLSEGLTVHAMATWILENREWDFIAVYLDTIDKAGHDFMIFHPPKMESIPDAEFELFQDVMTGVYKMHDLMLGRLMQLAGPDAAIMIVSDHGFSSGALRPPEAALFPDANPLAWHRQHGIFCLSGPGIRKDELVQGANLLDVVPTILTLFGLPAAEDMRGRVLSESFEEPSALERIPSWEKVKGEAGLHPADMEPDAWDAEAAMEQLAALGYIDAPSADLVQRRESAADFQKFTLARVHLGNSRPAEAIPLLEGLLKKDPSNVHFKLSLGQAYFLAGQYERSEQMGAELLAETNQKGIAHVLRANACIFQNNREEALGHLLKAEEESGENPNTRFLIAQAHFRLRRLGDAEENFRKALEIDPNLAKAWCGLASALTAQKRYSEAAEAAMEAVGLEYSMPVAHFLLGVALAQAGSTESGVRALETCVKLYPQSLLAHRWLAAIHTRVTGDAERARQHSESAEEIAADRRSAAQPEETPAARG